ncbi:MAG: Helix-turn-helix domain [Solirubrobacteraceae bacterium]|jgi:excisionase family DNA binding protein|nr:Helix-turn-helix domain [Solirubrobacteraceae bacterium]
MRVAEVAPILGVSRQRAYQLIYAGEIPHIRMGERCIRIPRGAFETWLVSLDERALNKLRTNEAPGGTAESSGQTFDGRDGPRDVEF